jgi:hypothetical protein
MVYDTGEWIHMIFQKKTMIYISNICINIIWKIEFWESEWLLFNANSAIYLQQQFNFQWDDDEVRFVLDQHA